MRLSFWLDTLVYKTINGVRQYIVVAVEKTVDIQRLAWILPICYLQVRFRMSMLRPPSSSRLISLSFERIS